MTLKSIKISKILKEIGVVNILGQAQLDIMISNLMRNSSSKKIEFPQFTKLLCEVSEKAKVELESLAKCIIAH